jgi:hypothetical protein
MSEQLADFSIRRLSEVLVPVADSGRVPCDRADDLVNPAFNSSQVWGEAVGTATTIRAGSCCRNALTAARIVAPVARPSSTRSQSDHALERRTTAAISTLAPRQLLAFLCRHSVDHIVRNTQLPDDLVVEDADIPVATAPIASSS